MREKVARGLSDFIFVVQSPMFYHFRTLSELISEEVAVVRILHPKYVKTPGCTQGSQGYPSLAACLPAPCGAAARSTTTRTPPLSPTCVRASVVRLLAESGNIPMEDITATVSSSPPLKKHKRSCHPIREGEARRGRTKEEGRRGKFGFCLAKKVRALPQVLFLSNREFLQHDFPKQNDLETKKTVPFFFLNVKAQCTDKWIEKRTPVSPSFLPSIDDCGCDCDCDPGDDLFGKRDEIVPVGPTATDCRDSRVGSFLSRLLFMARGAFCSVPRLLFSLFPINFGLGLRKAIHSIHFWTDGDIFLVVRTSVPRTKQTSC